MGYPAPVPTIPAASRSDKGVSPHSLLKAALAGADKSGEMSWATFFLPVLIVLGGGLLIGVLFRWWGLLVAVGFAAFLMYAWEFYGPAVAYAVIAGGIASAGVVTGALLRRRPGRGGARRRVAP
jgi:hypothetical protein